MKIQKIETDSSQPYRDLLERISRRYVEGQVEAVRSVNEAIIETNWSIGQYIVEYEQEGKRKAEYGKALLENLSKDLTLLHGRGFSRSNLQRMRQFYLASPICAKPSHKLSWSHWVELLKVSYYLCESKDNNNLSKCMKIKSLYPMFNYCFVY